MAEIPQERYSVEGRHGRAPVVGDISELDQGYAGADGSPMVLAYCKGDDGTYIYAAHVYESELGPPLCREI